jgi:hypothetical protein
MSDLKMKKYTDVLRYGKKETNIFNVGDPIVIQEKLDGANASILREGNQLLCYSRNHLLDESNTLRGFFNWVQTLNPEDFKEGFVYFGEWLVKHKLIYGEEHMNKFYLFDIYDRKEQKYLHYSSFDDLAPAYIERVPTFYDGPYISDDHLRTFLGKTAFPIPEGEGIVIKNTDYVDRYGHQKFVKMVTESFSEKSKKKNPTPVVESEEQKFARQYVTPARVEKILYKLVDEGVIPEEYSKKELGLIMKNLVPRVYDDIIKEETDEMPEDFDLDKLRKGINKITPSIVKKLLAQR